MSANPAVRRPAAVRENTRRAAAPVAVRPVVALAARGVSVEIVEMPDRFVAGAAPTTVTVVASRSGGGSCLKVLWSLVLQVDGLSVEQVQVDRVEENGSFPVRVENQGGTARFTDRQFDPGTLCGNRTVTARYRVNVARDVPAGRLTLLTEAYDAGLRLLERDSATREIVAAGQPSPSPSVDPEPTGNGGAGAGGTPTATGAGAAPDVADTGAPGSAVAQNPAGNDQNGLPLAWFLIGGLMVFLGLSLLLNVRWRHRSEAVAEATGGTLPPVSGPPLLSRYRTVPRRFEAGPGRARDW